MLIINADDWGRKALAASRKADELRSGGNAADADKFDALAKVALGRQLSAAKEARTVEPTIPPKVEYELTELGRTLLVPVRALEQWALDHRMMIHAAQQKFDEERREDTAA